MRCRIATLLTVVLAAGVLAGPVAPARADGDPASDVLLTGDVYYPYEPAVTTVAKHQLTRAIAAARRAGTPFKVALIASPIDLGAVPQQFGNPQQYATFLASEITPILGKTTLIVVMPSGLGFAGTAQGAATAAAKDIKLSDRPDSDQLLDAAGLAVLRTAKALGKPAAGVEESAFGGGSGSGGGGGSAVTIVLVVVGLGLLTALALALRLRAGAAQGGDSAAALEPIATPVPDAPDAAPGAGADADTP